MKKLSCAILILFLLFVLLPASVSAETLDVYVSSTGSDENSGTAEAPYATLAKAIEEVANNGTIHVVGTVAVPSDFSWSTHGKSMTITGGVLDFTAMDKHVSIGDAVHFHDLTLNFDSGDFFYAAGNKVVIGENVTISNMINLFGGSNYGTVASTELTVLSGDYLTIYGGGYHDTVTGDVKLTVGGNTNASAGAPGDANDKYMIFGGGCHGTVKGKAYLTFTGNAIANYVFGGGAYSGSVEGGTETLFSGGQAMTVYGASYKVAQTFDAHLVITGGELEQAFGGSLEGAHNGNVTMEILGGTITRRVFGGCYNDCSFTGTWASSNYVNGHIRLLIGGEANIALTHSDDLGIYARSRQATVSATETSELIFADSDGYSTYKDKIGAQSSWMTSFMGDVTAADEMHYLACTASGATVTGTCAYHAEETATATLSLDSTASLQYTGKPITPVKLETTGTWYTELPEIVYTNNTKEGAATASITVDGATASLNFEIEPVYFRSVSLNESIAINFKATRSFLEARGFEKIEFYMDGNLVQTITGIPAGNASRVSFTFNQLTPAQMGKDITARFCFADGTYDERSTSVLDYALSMLGKTKDAKLKILLVDMIHYGAATQTYVGLADGETLVSAGDYADLGTTVDPELVNHTALSEAPETEQATWLSAGLNLKDSVTVRLKFSADSVDGLTLKVTHGGSTWEITDFRAATGGYYAYFSGLNPAQLRDTFEAALYNADGAKVSKTLTYSVVSYAYAVANGSDEALKPLTTALMRYSDAVSAWVNSSTVSGTLVKVDQTELPDTILIKSSTVNKVVSVAEDGSFSAELPAGSYEVDLNADGYRVVCDKIVDGNMTVAEGENALGQIKLLQILTADYTWWGGSTKTENGASVTLSTASGVNILSATEYKIGSSFKNATSWMVEAWVEADSNGKVGISVGRDDGKNGTVLFYIDKGQNTCGFFTWDTFQYTGGLGLRGEQSEPTITAQKSGNYTLKEILGDALSSRYKLTLLATDITEEGTGTLTLYVNDIECLKMYAVNFTGLKVDDYKGIADQKMDLANSHVSLVTVGANISATFTDYYCSELKYGTVSGQLVKLDGTAGFPETVTLQSGVFREEVSVAADGTFTAQLPAGECTLTVTLDGYRAVYDAFKVTADSNTDVTVKLLQNLTADYTWWGGSTKTENGASVTLSTASGVNSLSATEYKIGSSLTDASAWKVTSHIEAGATGIVGFSVGRDDGKNGSVYLYVNMGNKGRGFYTWGTFKYSGEVPGITVWGANGSGTFSEQAIKDALASENGYDLTLMATDINGEGTGMLTLYVNETAVLTMDTSLFTGLKVDEYKGIADQKLDLANSHVSLVAMGTNISATFTDYYVAEMQCGTVSGQLVKVDGTAGFPATVTLQSGVIHQDANVAEDGTFSATVPVGSYTLTTELDGYRTVCDEFSVTEGQSTNVTVKLLQNLTADYKWWGGSSKAENGASVTLSTVSGVNTLSATEYKIGNSIENATSWTVETWVEADSSGKVGISVGNNADDSKNGTVLFYIDKGQNTCGFHTWDTFQYTGNLALRGEQPEPTITTQKSGNYSLKTILGDALSSRYKLTLKATDISEEGTGILTLYVNDIECLKMYAVNFTGLKVDDYKGAADDKMDLANSHVSLVVVGANISATFTDYYYTCETQE